MAYLDLGPGDILGPNFGHPNDPRNDADDFLDSDEDEEEDEFDDEEC
jgi:hypothetical protein